MRRLLFSFLWIFQCVIVVSAAEDGSWLNISAGAGRLKTPIHFVATDPMGRRTGIQPGLPFIWEMHNASYGIESIGDDETDEPGPEGPELNHHNVLRGTYTITVYALDTTTYSLTVVAVDQQRNNISPVPETREGLLLSGASMQYTVNVDPTPGAGRSTLLKIVTSNTLRQDLTVARQLGQVANDGIFNSLLQKVDSAEKQAAKGQKKAAANILGAFINEVEAQAGKQIDTFAANVLKQDAETLKKTLQ